MKTMHKSIRQYSRLVKNKWQINTSLFKNSLDKIIIFLHIFIKNSTYTPPCCVVVCNFYKYKCKVHGWQSQMSTLIHSFQRHLRIWIDILQDLTLILYYILIFILRLDIFLLQKQNLIFFNRLVCFYSSLSTLSDICVMFLLTQIVVTSSFHWISSIRTHTTTKKSAFFLYDANICYLSSILGYYLKQFNSCITLFALFL